jgi:Nif-specific regulatory protein
VTTESPAVEAGPLATLLEIGQTLASELELSAALARVLETLERNAGMVRGAVMALDAATKEIGVEVSLGLGAGAQRDRCKLGEGIAGRVVESGRPIVVAEISREPLLLHRVLEGESPVSELTFVCVPIALEGKPVGALAVDLVFEEARDYEGSQRFFALVAAMIAQALRVHRLRVHRMMEDERKELRDDQQKRHDFSSIVGTSGPIRQAHKQIAQVAPTNTTVLIRGESGTGKELIARAIHRNSARAKKPFVKVTLGALPHALVDSELFGYEKGAFAGAMARKRGRFELAHGGTLFLDEVGELNAATQVKCLRVLQEREFERLGGTEPLKANVRLIATTSKNLEAAIAAKEFREDLYYRLNVFAILLPPLRERRADILLLAEHFLAKYSRAHRKAIRRISAAAVDMLMSYRWPGNVRELENTIERTVLTCESSAIEAHHLPPTLRTPGTPGTASGCSLSHAVERYEKDLILDALKSARGNCAQAARLLDTTERIIGYKIRKYRIDPQRFRTSGAGATKAGPPGAASEVG